MGKVGGATLGKGGAIVGGSILGVPRGVHTHHNNELIFIIGCSFCTLAQAR